MNFSTRAGGSLPGWSDRAGSRGSKTHGPCSPGRSGVRSCRSSIRFGSSSALAPLAAEIAMSLCTRSEGALGYWASLDLIAVHFRRMKAILESVNQATRAIGFGSESFLDDLAEATRSCGLSWNKEDALRVFDRTCVHHEPATIFHEAQALYEELGGQGPPLGQAERNGWLLARDARKCEALTQRLVSHRQSEAQQQLSQARDEARAGPGCVIRHAESTDAGSR